MPLLLLVFLSMTSGWAQYSEQPTKESTSDLRNQVVMFRVEIPSEKKTYLLERTANDSYVLRRKVKDDEETRKMPYREALKLDRDFASRFLRCQYELPTAEGNCEVSMKLNMKGEEQDICKKDEKKTQELSAFISELTQRF